MIPESWKVQVGDVETSAVFEPTSAGNYAGVFVCAHGAGEGMSGRGVLAAAAQMRTRGLDVVRFNFLYKERGSGRPDPMPQLQDCFSAVVDRVRAERSPTRLVIGGRSMGGRAASMMAARGYACDGLLLLAYPLHPDGQPEKLRDAHLPDIAIPTLALSGTRDALCRRDLMETVMKRVRPSFRLHWLEGADHSWHVLKSSGRADADVLDEAGRVTEEWLATVSS